MIIGVDPGVGGAIARLDDATNSLEIFDMPVYTITVGGTKKRRLNLHRLADMLTEWTMADLSIAVIEDVHALPKQGVASSFSFGRSFGATEMALVACNLPVHYVAPPVWKRILRVPADKDAARKRASELLPRHAHMWPNRTHDGRAEAALLAYYGSQFLIRARTTV